MPEPTETEAVRKILHETLAKNARAYQEIEIVKSELQTEAHGAEDAKLRAALEGIRERCASIKTLIEPPMSDR